MAGTEIALPLSPGVETFAAAGFKSSGWAAGLVELDPAMYFSYGFSLLW